MGGSFPTHALTLWRFRGVGEPPTLRTVAAAAAVHAQACHPCQLRMWTALPPALCNQAALQRHGLICLLTAVTLQNSICLAGRHDSIHRAVHATLPLVVTQIMAALSYLHEAGIPS